MRETLTTTPLNEREAAINKLKLIQELKFPKTREELSGFLMDNNITTSLVKTILTLGKQKAGKDNQNNLLHHSIVSGSLETPPGMEPNFFFAVVYPPNYPPEVDYYRPTTVGLYRKQPEQQSDRPRYLKLIGGLGIKATGLTTNLRERFANYVPPAPANFGLNLPLGQTGGLDLEAWEKSGYRSNPGLVASILKTSIEEMLLVLENEQTPEESLGTELELLAA